MKREDVWGSWDPPAPGFLVKAGNFLFLAMGAQGNTVEEAAEGFWPAVKEKLEKAGTSTGNIVQMTNFLVNMDDAAKVGAVRAKFLPQDRNYASVGVEISRLYKMDPPLQFEMQIVAIIPD